MLITYTSIIHFTQAGVLSANTVNLAQLYCYILNREKVIDGYYIWLFSDWTI